MELDLDLMAFVHLHASLFDLSCLIHFFMVIFFSVHPFLFCRFHFANLETLGRTLEKASPLLFPWRFSWALGRNLTLETFSAFLPSYYTTVLYIIIGFKASNATNNSPWVLNPSLGNNNEGLKFPRCLPLPFGKNHCLVGT